MGKDHFKAFGLGSSEGGDPYHLDRTIQLRGFFSLRLELLLALQCPKMKEEEARQRGDGYCETYQLSESML